MFYRCLPKHQKATRVTVFFQWHLLCQFLCLNSALSCKQLDFSKTSAQASRRLPTKDGSRRSQMTGNETERMCTRSRNRPQPVDARNLEQASNRGSVSSQDVNLCSPRPPPLHKSAKHPTGSKPSHFKQSKKDHGGYTQHWGNFDPRGVCERKTKDNSATSQT